MPMYRVRSYIEGTILVQAPSSTVAEAIVRQAKPMLNGKILIGTKVSAACESLLEHQTFDVDKVISYQGPHIN